MRCEYCTSTGHKRLYPDPRTPPLDTEDCLCKDCAIVGLEEEIENAEQRVEDLKEQLRRLK